MLNIFNKPENYKNKSPCKNCKAKIFTLSYGLYKI